MFPVVHGLSSGGSSPRAGPAWSKGHRRQLATVVGSVTVSRCALRAPGLANCYPADAVLGLPRERHSLGLRRLVVLEAIRGSYDQALEAIERRCGTRGVGKSQAEQLVRAAAVDVAGAEPVAGAGVPGVQRLQFFLSESSWEVEQINDLRLELLRE
ncbi:MULTISPECIES: hypothetical protein [unclassified Streptomyces]|uniref:hypothetical protein n=1 Tax=unclassified Streptomyces TaxID=2593676 RepID=UPI0036E44E45